MKHVLPSVLLFLAVASAGCTGQICSGPQDNELCPPGCGSRPLVTMNDEMGCLDEAPSLFVCIRDGALVSNAGGCWVDERGTRYITHGRRYDISSVDGWRECTVEESGSIATSTCTE